MPVRKRKTPHNGGAISIAQDCLATRRRETRSPSARMLPLHQPRSARRCAKPGFSRFTAWGPKAIRALRAALKCGGKRAASVAPREPVLSAPSAPP